MGNFYDKSTETTLHEICVQVFLRFSDSSKPNQSASLIYHVYELAWFTGIGKSEKNWLQTLCQVAPMTKVDDVTTIENNRHVRVNVDATLVAIFRI